jgi:hypothetical protein
MRQLSDAEAVAEARKRFPPTARSANWNLVMSHHRRKELNASEQALAAKGKPTVRVMGGDAESQDYDLFVGTKLIGSNSERAGITNGALLIVEAVSPDTARLRDEESGETVAVPLARLNRHTRLRHAITLASCQGRTLPGLVRLWDAGSRHMTAAHVYVAASRATSPELFEVM